MWLYRGASRGVLHGEGNCVANNNTVAIRGVLHDEGNYVA